MNLQRPDDPASIARCPCRRQGIDRREPFGDRCQSVLGDLRLQSSAEGPIGGDARDPPSFKDAIDVERGAADEEGEAAARQRRADGRHGQFLVGGKRHRLVGIDDVDEVVRHATSLGDRGFGDADIEPSVEIAGVGVRDLAIKAARELDGGAGFPDGRWPDDCHQFGARLGRVFGALLAVQREIAVVWPCHDG